MKEENERRIVDEKQVAEVDGKIIQCKSNISVANDLTDWMIELICMIWYNKYQIGSWREKHSEKQAAQQQDLSKRQVATEETKIWRRFTETAKVIVWKRKMNDCSF